MTVRRTLLTAACLLAALASPAAADRIFVQDRGSFEGRIASNKDGLMVVEANGWRVKLVAQKVLAVKRSSGWVYVPGANAAAVWQTFRRAHPVQIFFIQIEMLTFREGMHDGLCIQHIVGDPVCTCRMA